MSERQAKLNRKSAEADKKVKQPRDKKSTIATAVAVVLLVAAAGAGGYASWQKIQADKPASQQSEQQAPTTIADIAAEQNMTADELLEKIGLADELTAESTESDLMSKLTIEGYAKMEDKTAADVKKEFGIESLEDTELWQSAQMKVPMGKIAEQNGMSFADFAAQNNFPAEITEKTTYQEAIIILQSAQAVAQSEADEGDTGAAEAENE